MSAAYSQSARDYLAGGWHPLPVIDHGKGQVPAGYTGYKGTRVRLEDIERWEGQGLGGSNVCLRLMHEVGLDVDAHDSTKDAAATMGRCTARYGMLPPTVRVSSRFGPDYDGLSGIRIYRLPDELRQFEEQRVWHSELDHTGSGIDIIRLGHRQVVAWPSVHPKRGGIYRWMDERTGQIVAGPLPAVETLPVLPDRWAEALIKTERRTDGRTTAVRVAAASGGSRWWTTGAPCPAVSLALSKALSGFSDSRHKATRDGVLRLTRAGEQGHKGVRSAVDALHEAFVEAAGEADRDAEGEWTRMTESIDSVIESMGLTPEADRGCSCPEDEAARRPPMRDQLVNLIEAEFEVGRTIDDKPFIIERAGINLALFSGAAKSRLAVRLREIEGISPSRTALDEAWVHVEGISTGLPKVELPLRVAAWEGSAILDIGDHEGRCVVISADGWRVLDRSPVPFRRTKATGPLPIPRAGGSSAALWSVVNVAVEDRPLIRAWLASCLIPDIPHPIVRITGEQGAAKTTGCAYLGRTLDPSSVDVLSVPKDAARWEVTTNARWLIPVDNVSKIDPWWSDDLCRTSTGAGTLDRALYTDSDVTTRFMRGCVMLNGITMTGSLRADLAERLLAVEMLRPTEYRTERVLSATFEDAHPHILAAILDDVVRVLRNLPTAEPPRGIRMADFAAVLAAFDGAPGGPAMTAYLRQAEEASHEAFESDVVAMCVVDFMEGRDEWSGTAAALYGLLERIRRTLIEAGEVSGESYWPKGGAGLSKALSRSGKTLRDKGITYARERGAQGARTLVLSRAGDSCDSSDGSSPLGALSGSERPVTPSTPLSDTENASRGEQLSPPSQLSPDGFLSTVQVTVGDSWPSPTTVTQPDPAVTAVTSVTDPPAYGSGPTNKSGDGGDRSGSGSLLDLLRPCEICGLPAVTSPCTECRRAG